MSQPVIKIVKIHEKAMVPKYATKGSACVDLCAAEDGSIQPGETVTIAVGLKFAIQEGYACIFKERSGLAVKNQIALRAGVIDSDYRGPIMVILVNEAKEAFIYKSGDRLCQMKVEKVIQPIFQEVAEEELGKTERGEGGFGSTGISSETEGSTTVSSSADLFGNIIEKTFEFVWEKLLSGWKEDQPDDCPFKTKEEAREEFLQWFKEKLLFDFSKEVFSRQRSKKEQSDNKRTPPSSPGPIKCPPAPKKRKNSASEGNNEESSDFGPETEKLLKKSRV